MVEGPGHMALNEIAANMIAEKRICSGAPFLCFGAFGNGCCARI